MTAKTPRCHEFLKRQREEFRVAMETAQREHREQMGAMVRIHAYPFVAQR